MITKIKIIAIDLDRDNDIIYIGIKREDSKLDALVSLLNRELEILHNERDFLQIKEVQ